jgi:hypothetical protein
MASRWLWTPAAASRFLALAAGSTAVPAVGTRQVIRQTLTTCGEVRCLHTRCQYLNVQKLSATLRKSFQFQTTAVQGVAFGQSTRPVGVHSVNARLCLLSTKFVRWQSDTELGEKVFIFCRKGWSDKILVFICQIPYATHIRETLNVPYLNIFILFYDQRVT